MQLPSLCGLQEVSVLLAYLCLLPDAAVVGVLQGDIDAVGGLFYLMLERILIGIVAGVVAVNPES